MIRVFLVDDYQAVRSGIRALIEPAEDIVICGEAADVDAAIEGCASTCPSILLADIGLSGERTGFDLLEEVRALYPDIKCVMLTASTRPQDVQRAMRGGARGYLTQAALSEDRLVAAIRAVAAGGIVLDEAVAKSAVGGDSLSLSLLTRRELETLRLVGRCLSNKQIAAELAIDPKTVRNHLNRAYAKVGVQSRVQAAILANEAL